MVGIFIEYIYLRITYARIFEVFGFESHVLLLMRAQLFLGNVAAIANLGPLFLFTLLRIL